MAITKYPKAGDVILQVARELKLGLAAGSDPFASADPNIIQICALLTTCGKKLVKDFEWGHLTSEGQIVADGVNSVYALPPDFLEMTEQTGWDRTNRTPLMGPLNAQQWQYLKAWQQGITIYVGFRLQPNEIWFWPMPPPAGHLITLEYRSSSWVIPNGVPPGNYNSLGAAGSDTPATYGDILLFDQWLLERMLKLYWKNENGFESTTAGVEFGDAYEKVTGQANASQVLSLNGPRLGIAGSRMLDSGNIPITNIGGGH